ncbi:MAG: hypothetical protein KFW21_07050 [Spirochaetota bacterium]|nr:hypothetical protein [Spirochaetota bacterium]
MKKYLLIILEMIVHIGKIAIVYFSSVYILEFCRQADWFEDGYKVAFNTIVAILTICLLTPILTFNINKYK